MLDKVAILKDVNMEHERMGVDSVISEYRSIIYCVK